VLECAGHRRSEYQPATRGLPWQTGAVSEAVWAGTSLAHVLEQAGVRDGRFVLLEGADRGHFRGAGDFAFARALPIAKALEPDTLLAWQMNDEPLPPGHGAPLRAIVPGWYATDSVKWLRRITVRDQRFAGPFEAIDYRLARDSEQRGARLTTLAVHSLITSLGDGERVAAGEQTLRGIAWGGTGGVARVEISVDGGDWQAAELKRSAGRYARRHWRFAWRAQPGLRTVAVRATDAARSPQPPEPPWNEGGYANASIQRARVRVESRPR
jgi:DMSO/TMAO reductase YedYZ molybdopterin-dependent catalytic subunit